MIRKYDEKIYNGGVFLKANISSLSNKREQKKLTNFPGQSKYVGIK